MARPLKAGLSYFPFDVDTFQDEKIIGIAGGFGLKGEITAVKLLCAVYRNGYFLEWNEVTIYKMLHELPGVSAELLQQIVSRLVKWGFFDKNLFDSAKVLTSKTIQQRYFSAVSRRKIERENLPFLLVNVYTNPVNADNNPVNVDINATNKRKEKKKKELSKESKKKIAKTDFFSLSVEEVRFFLSGEGLAATDAEDFLNYYNTVGWVESGGMPVADWKAAARRWNARELRRGTKPRTPARGLAAASPSIIAKLERDDKPADTQPRNGVGSYETYCRSIGVDPATPAAELLSRTVLPPLGEERLKPIKNNQL